MEQKHLTLEKAFKSERNMREELAEAKDILEKQLMLEKSEMEGKLNAEIEGLKIDLKKNLEANELAEDGRSEEVVSLRSQLGETKLELSAALEENQKQAEEKYTIAQTMHEQRSSLANLEQERDRLIEELQDKVSVAVELEERNKGLREEMEALKEKVKHLTMERDCVSNENLSLVSAVSKGEEAHEEISIIYENRIKEMQQSADVYLKEREEMFDSRLEELEKANEALVKEMSMKEDRLKEYEIILADVEKQFTDKDEELRVRDEELNQLKGELVSQREKVLSEESDRNTIMISKMQEAFEEEKKALKLDIDELAVGKAQLESELSRRAELYEEVEGKCHQLASELTSLQEASSGHDVKEVLMNNRRLSKEIGEAKERIEKLTQDKRVLLEEKQKMQPGIFEQEISALEEQLESSATEYENMLAQKVKENEEAIVNIGKLKEELKLMRQGEERLRRESFELSSSQDMRLEECSREIEELKNELSNVKALHGEAVGQFEMQLNSVNDYNSQLRNAIEQWQTKDSHNENTIRILESQIEAYKSKDVEVRERQMLDDQMAMQKHVDNLLQEKLELEEKMSQISFRYQAVEAEKMTWQTELSLINEQLENAKSDIVHKTELVKQLEGEMDRYENGKSVDEQTISSLQQEHLDLLSKLKNAEIMLKKDSSVKSKESYPLNMTPVAATNILNMLTEIEDVLDLPTRDYTSEDNCHTLVQSVIGIKEKVWYWKKKVESKDDKIVSMKGELTVKDDIVRRLSSVQQPPSKREIYEYVTPIEERREELNDISELTNQLEEKQEELEALRQKYLNLEIKCEMYKRNRRHSGLSSEIDGVFPSLNELAEVNRSLQSRCDALEKAVQELQPKETIPPAVQSETQNDPYLPKGNHPFRTFVTEENAGVDDGLYAAVFREGSVASGSADTSHVSREVEAELSSDARLQAYQDLLEHIENVPDLSSEEFIKSLNSLQHVGRSQGLDTSGVSNRSMISDASASSLMGKMQQAWQSERDVFWEKLNSLKVSFLFVGAKNKRGHELNVISGYM